MKTKIAILVILGCLVVVLTVIVVGNFLGKDVIADSASSLQSLTPALTQTHSATAQQQASRPSYTSLTLLSVAFEDGKTIPVEYTCDGKGANPALEFVAVPPTTKSLAVIMEDPDMPKTIQLSGVWTHWMVWNIPAAAKGIASGQKIAGSAGVVGKNTSGSMEYTPPCPPDAEHQYAFTLYALDTLLTLDPATATKDQLVAAMKGHVIEQSVLTGRYTRQ